MAPLGPGGSGVTGTARGLAVGAAWHATPNTANLGRARSQRPLAGRHAVACAPTQAKTQSTTQPTAQPKTEPITQAPAQPQPASPALVAAPTPTPTPISKREPRAPAQPQAQSNPLPPQPSPPAADAPTLPALPKSLASTQPAVPAAPAAAGAQLALSRPPQLLPDKVQPPPRYPALSQRLGEQGTVWLRAEVGADGRVQQVQLLKPSPYPRLNRAAQDAVSQWQYHPGTDQGTPVAMWLEVPVRFELR